MTDGGHLLPFGEETFDHVPDEYLLKIVKAKKPYDLQDVAELVWYNSKRAPQNMNVKLEHFGGMARIWMGRIDCVSGWRQRLSAEVIQRMVEIMCQRIALKLEGQLTSDEVTWLEGLADTRDKRYTMLLKGIERLLSKNTTRD